jgi:hypothetical protein
MEDKIGNPNEPSRSFSEAIELLKKGKKLTRINWNGANQYVFLQKEQDYKETVLSSHLVIKTVSNTFVPWLASQTDLLAHDWQIVN